MTQLCPGSLDTAPCGVGCHRCHSRGLGLTLPSQRSALQRGRRHSRAHHDPVTQIRPIRACAGAHGSKRLKRGAVFDKAVVRGHCRPRRLRRRFLRRVRSALIRSAWPLAGFVAGYSSLTRNVSRCRRWWRSRRLKWRPRAAAGHEYPAVARGQRRGGVADVSPRPRRAVVPPDPQPVAGADVVALQAITDWVTSHWAQ